MYMVYIIAPVSFMRRIYDRHFLMAKSFFRHVQRIFLALPSSSVAIFPRRRGSRGVAGDQARNIKRRNFFIVLSVVRNSIHDNITRIHCVLFYYLFDKVDTVRDRTQNRALIQIEKFITYFNVLEENIP